MPPNTPIEVVWFQGVGFAVGLGLAQSGSAIERNYDHARPLWGLLAFLAAEGPYSMDNLTDALTALHDGTVTDESTEVRRVAEIVTRVKRCGDG